MAITVESKPRTTTPAYNPVVWWVSSTNVANTGFKFVFDIYDSTATKIAEYRVSPRISDNFGEIDLSRLLQSKLSEDLDLTNTTYWDATGHYYNYGVEIGEEYNETYAYTGFTQSGDYVQLTGFSAISPHAFVVGDQVNLTEGTPTNDLLAGLHTVTAVGATTVTIDVIYDDMISPSSTAGDLIYADNRKTINRSLSINSNYYVTKSALPMVQRRDFNDSDYHLTGVSSQFMCNFPNDFRITDSQELYVQYMPQTTAVRRMYFENSDGDTFYKTVTPSSGEWVNLSGVAGAGVGTLTVVSGSLPLVKTTTEWYEFTYVDNTNTAVSETKRLYIDTRCQQEAFEILFLDRWGSWGSFSFNLKAQEKEMIKRELYNKSVLGEDNSGVWRYDYNSKGFTVHSITLDKELTLNTNWMTQSDNEYFKELVSSPATYLYGDDSQYISITIKEKDEEIVRQKGRNLIRKTITIIPSIKEVVNG